MSPIGRAAGAADTCLLRVSTGRSRHAGNTRATAKEHQPVPSPSRPIVDVCRRHWPQHDIATRLPGLREYATRGVAGVPLPSTPGGGEIAESTLIDQQGEPPPPLHLQFYFFLKKGKQPKKRLGQRATQEHATSRTVSRVRAASTRTRVTKEAPGEVPTRTTMSLTHQLARSERL